jgi:hypothetical protein
MTKLKLLTQEWINSAEGKKYILLAHDLYWLRYTKPGEPWYELTDYLRDKLTEDGFDIKYTEDDVLFSGLSMKGIGKKG